MFGRKLLRHLLNFIRSVIVGIASRVLDACERDRAKARNDVGVGEPIKAINAVRRLECDAHAGFGFAPNKLDQATTQRATQQRVLAPNSVFISR